MKAIKKLALVWLLILVYSGSSFAISTEKPISLQLENLTRWKTSHEALAIQQSLRTILKSNQNSQKINVTFASLRQYFSLFKRSFLVLDAESNDLGGFFALVVFKEYPKVLRLWIYEIDKNIFEIREATPLQVTLDNRIMNELADQRITPFWLSSLSQ